MVSNWDRVIDTYKTYSKNVHSIAKRVKLDESFVEKVLKKEGLKPEVKVYPQRKSQIVKEEFITEDQTRLKIRYKKPKPTVKKTVKKKYSSKPNSGYKGKPTKSTSSYKSKNTVAKKNLITNLKTRKLFLKKENKLLLNPYLFLLVLF